MSIGVAIIGSGIFVQEEHLVIPQPISKENFTDFSKPAVKACPLLTLKAIYSRSLKSAQALNTTADLYSDDSGSGHTYHDLLLRDDIHAVILALPIVSQPEFVEAALAAGKHVLSEKPVAKDIERAERLIAYSKSGKVKGGATWGVAENFRFLESFEYGREQVEKLGRILGFRVKMFTNVKKGGKYFGKPLNIIGDV
jgi:predicted dehydrogenase